MKKRHLISILGILFLCACEPQGVTDLAGFVADDTVRLEIDGERVLSYDPVSCQLAYNEKRCEFRLNTDTMLDYFVLSLSEIPANPKTAVTATITWSTTSGERTKNNITLYAKRIQGDILWLCDDSCRNAAVVRVLE